MITYRIGKFNCICGGFRFTFDVERKIMICFACRRKYRNDGLDKETNRFKIFIQEPNSDEWVRDERAFEEHEIGRVEN